MSELVQKQRQYTFEEICPIWSELLSKQKTGGIMVNGKYMSLDEPSRCVMGEAFDGNSYQDQREQFNNGIVDLDRRICSCNECDYFDKHVRNLIVLKGYGPNADQYYSHQIERQKQWIDAFTRHMNEKHRDILEARLGK